VRSDDHAQVIDARRRRWCWSLCLRHLVMHMAADDERDRLANRSASQNHIQVSQILRIGAQLNTPTDQRRSTE
jgi:hypothetical protein